MAGTLDDRIIVIDPGHGAGYNPNYPGAPGESRYTHWAGVYLAENLRQLGARVYLTPSHLSPGNRAAVANRMGADLLISIHGDASQNNYGRGIQTIYELSKPFNDQRSLNAAQTIQASLGSSLNFYGANNAGIGQPDGNRTALKSLGVLREAHVPAVLVEIGMAPGSMGKAVQAEVDMMSLAVKTRSIDTKQDSLRSVRGMADGIEKYFTNGSSTPLKQNSPGGVLLDKPAEVLFDIGNIRAALFDRAAAQLIIIADRKTLMPAAAPDYLRVGLNCAASREGPGVSIDPSTEPGQMNVRYIGSVKGTSVGYIMFEADRLLKSLSLGYDNITRSKIICPVEGYKSMPDMTASISLHKDNQEGAFLRFWFVPRRITIELDKNRDAAVFKEVSIELKAEVLDPDLPESIHVAANEFARFFTDNYDQFAAEYPILAELKQVAQAVALGRWLVDERPYLRRS